MSPDELRGLIAAGETFTVEFKGERRAPLSDDDLVEAAVCLANGEGGLLLVGVEDDGVVTGARPRHAGGVDPRRIEALIGNRTNPPLAARCTVTDLAEGRVVVVDVPEATTPVGTVDGRYVRRALVGRGTPGCRPMHFHEMQSRQASRGALDYSELELAGASWEDLDPLEFERFRRLVRESRGRGDAALASLPDVELAKSLGVVEANHEVRRVRVAGLLLFGREEALHRLVPTHEVAFQDVRGVAVGTNDFLRWPLPRAMEELLARFRARNREEELLVDGVRVAVPDYPTEAYREAVANALVHRDYQRLGAVHVQWREQRITVGNPGGFPMGVRQDNLLVAQPRPRNPLLADAFKRAGLAERTGRGVDAMFEEQLRYGRPPPDYGLSDADSVTVELWDGPANLDLLRLVVASERSSRPLSVEELLVLTRALAVRRMVPEVAASLIQRPAASGQVVLEQLAERGLLRRSGDGFVPTGEPPPADPSAEVLNLASARGRVTRADVAAATGLSADQAKRLLTRLVAEGRLYRQGSGRGVTYAIRRSGESGA